MSWRPEVIADETGNWLPNGLRFATEAEALANAKDLQARWFMVTDVRAMPSEDPVNYKWIAGFDSLAGWIPGHLESVEGETNG